MYQCVAISVDRACLWSVQIGRLDYSNWVIDNVTEGEISQSRQVRDQQLASYISNSTLHYSSNTNGEEQKLSTRVV